eukprot:18085-Heterococcus_DN1.PRE.2
MLIKGLSPGTQYRYRVVALGKDSVTRGPCGDSVVANTLLETPPPSAVLPAKGQHNYYVTCCCGLRTANMIVKRHIAAALTSLIVILRTSLYCCEHTQSVHSALSRSTRSTPSEAVHDHRGGSGIGDTYVRIKWDAASALSQRSRRSGIRGEQHVAAILTQWTKAAKEDPGVSIALAFSNASWLVIAQRINAVEAGDVHSMLRVNISYSSVVVFRYDRDSSGAMDAVEVGSLLKDLGVTPTEERLHAAFAEFDSNGDGLVTLEEASHYLFLEQLPGFTHITTATTVSNYSQWALLSCSVSADLLNTSVTVLLCVLCLQFEAWWRRDDITYVLKRDEGTSAREVESMPDTTTSTTAANSATANSGSSGVVAEPPLKITSYRGSATQCEIAGLVPNTLYRMRLRHTTSRSQSALSGSLEVMTAPRQPPAPLCVRVEAHAAVLKWYPGPGGAYKYTLQSRFVESLESGTGTAAMIAELRAHHRSCHTTSPHFSRLNVDFDSSLPKDIHVESSFNSRLCYTLLEQLLAHPHTCSTSAARKLADEGWVTVYEGVDNSVRITGLQSGAVYRFRVAAVNARGGSSLWSELAQVNGCTTVISNSRVQRPLTGYIQTALTLCAQQFTP